MKPRERTDVYARRMAEATANLAAWHGKHVAEYDAGTLGGEPVELLLWHEPGTGIGRMRFMCVGPRLIVTGDHGEAIYCRAPDLRWWAGLNLQYFVEKCQASEHGRIPVAWDGEEAGGEAATENEHDWTEFCRDYGDELFGEDWWEIRFGRVISYATACHLAGLKLAVTRLDASAAPPAPPSPDSSTTTGVDAERHPFAACPACDHYPHPERGCKCPPSPGNAGVDVQAAGQAGAR
jgi:hypothetical protein